MTMTLISDSVQRCATRRHLTAAASILAMSFVLSACSDSGSTTPHETHNDESEQTSAEETETAQPRLVITHDGSATVLDAVSLEIIATFPVDGIVRAAVASDDRHVYLAPHSGGDVLALDVGSYANAHGDHSHFYVREPAFRDFSIEAERPSHFVSGSDRTAIFDDATGTTMHFRDAGLLIGNLDISTIEGTAHHGVAVPIADGELLISTTSDGEGADGIVHVSESGDVIGISPACTQLHGQASTHDAVLFGCQGSVLVYADGEFASIPLGTEHARVSSLSGDDRSDIVLGNYSDTEIALIDVSSASVQIVDLGASYASLGRGAHGEAVVLASDGALHVIDPETGDTTAVVDAIDPFSIETNSSDASPAFVIIGHTAYVTDAAGSRVVGIDLDEGTVLGEVDFDSAPFAIVATNTAHLHGGSHDHDHDEDDHDH